MSSFPVELAVYDLSRGMAGQLSTQFLGTRIDIIPHTGILIYGREYFFGGAGIQHEDPNQFRQMRGIYPVQVISLGTTSVSREEFHAWCRSCVNSGKYLGTSYDLLTRNCNNFSHDAALGGLNLPVGVPDWILDVPRKFLSSPMGQMVRPMLEGMQMREGNGVPLDLFSNTPDSSETSSSNPWANMSEPTPKSESIVEDEKCKATATKMVSTPILDSYCKPLVSSEYKTIALCVKKISSVLEEADQKVLQALGHTLTTTHSLNEEEVELASRIIFSKVLKEEKSSVMTFALMLLRIIVLESNGQETAMKECLAWIEEQLVLSNQPNSSEMLLKASHTARSMAWLTLANAASLSFQKSISEQLLDTLFIDWGYDTQPRAEIRQAAAAFSYNYVLQSLSMSLSTTKELTDNQVSLLCGSLESITEETDATTKLRRLLVAARILVPKDSKVQDTKVRALMQDLGFPEVIQDLGTGSTVTAGNVKDASKCRELAGEVLELLK